MVWMCGMILWRESKIINVGSRRKGSTCKEKGAIESCPQSVVKGRIQVGSCSQYMFPKNRIVSYEMGTLRQLKSAFGFEVKESQQEKEFEQSFVDFIKGFGIPGSKQSIRYNDELL